MANSRTWMMFKMRQHKNTECTPSELKLHQEIIDNCFSPDMSMIEISKILYTQFNVRNLIEVDCIRPTIPPPRLDIAIPELKIAIRVNGGIHEPHRQRLKDEDQGVVLEGNGWTVIDVDYSDREDLWK